MRIGIYAGSFNPYHKGHADITWQAHLVFDKLIVAVGNNTEKSDRELSSVVPDCLPVGVELAFYDGLLSDYLRKLQLEFNTSTIFLVRGLRNDKDLPYEQNFAKFLRDMYSPLKVVYFTCDPKFEHISSSALRALKKVSEEEYQKYIL